MKKIVILLLCICLLPGCTAGAVHSVDPAAAGPVGGPAAQQAADPDPAPEGPFLSYSRYDQPGWETLDSAVMFSCDLDQDGREEEISFTILPEEWNTIITWGESSVRLDAGDEFIRADVMDLDPESPFYNLLVIMDYGSDSYVSVELHPENGQLVRGTEVEGWFAWYDGALWFSQRTDLLGTAYGTRSYHGDDLVPDSDWLTMEHIPTEEELETEWEDLYDLGILLRVTSPVPCVIDGRDAWLEPDTYVYRLRFKDTQDLLEVTTTDGTVALIAFSEEDGEWPYTADDICAEDYFDNLCYYD